MTAAQCNHQYASSSTAMLCINLICMLVNQLHWQQWKSLQTNCIEDLGVHRVEKNDWIQSIGQYEWILPIRFHSSFSLSLLRYWNVGRFLSLYASSFGERLPLLFWMVICFLLPKWKLQKLICLLECVNQIKDNALICERVPFSFPG